MFPITQHPMFKKHISSSSFSYGNLHFSLDFNRVGNVVFCTGKQMTTVDTTVALNDHTLIGSVPSGFEPVGSASIYFRGNYIFLSIESDGKIYLFTTYHFFDRRDDKYDSYASGSWLTLGNHPSYISPKYDYFYNDYWNKYAKTELSYNFSQYNNYIMKLDLSRIGRFVHLNGVFYDDTLYNPSLMSANKLIPYGYRPFSPNHVPLVGCGIDSKYTIINKEGDLSASGHIDKLITISGLWITTDYI